MGMLTSFFDLVEGSSIGFRMDETMSGSHEFEEGEGPPGRHPFRFEVRWGPDDLGPWLRPGGSGFMSQRMSGRVTVGGLCEDAPVEGTLEMNYFSEGTIRYDFEFVLAGKRYTYLGEKVNIRPWNLPVSHTTCFGVLKEADSGKLVSRSLTFFEFKTLPSFLASFRLTRKTRKSG